MAFDKAAARGPSRTRTAASNARGARGAPASAPALPRVPGVGSPTHFSPTPLGSGREPGRQSGVW